jgi:hypothetical protein
LAPWTPGRILGGESPDLGAFTLGNHVAGLDAVAPLGTRWRTEGQLLWSETDTSEAAISGPAWRAAFSRGGDKFSFDATQWGVSPGFRAENGFLEEVGRIGGKAKAALHFRGLSWSRSVSPYARAALTTDMEGTPTDLQAGGGWEAFVGEKAYTEGDIAFVQERFWNETFNRWTAEGFAALPPSATSNLFVGWDLGPTPHYAALTPDDLYLGFRWGIFGGYSASALDRLTFDEELILEQFRQAAFGELVYNTVISRTTLGLNLSRPVSIRVIEQVDSYDQTLDSSLLLAWEQSYGTALWLGYGETYDAGDTAWSARSVFAKFSWLFRG